MKNKDISIERRKNEIIKEIHSYCIQNFFYRATYLKDMEYPKDLNSLLEEYEYLLKLQVGS